MNKQPNNRFNCYEDKGLTGLANVGNSCYLNACMQILSHTYELSEFLKKGTYKGKINRVADSVLILEWDKLREMMWSDTAQSRLGVCKGCPESVHAEGSRFVHWKRTK